MGMNGPAWGRRHAAKKAEEAGRRIKEGPAWQVIRIRKKGERVGTFNAKTADEAIDKAMEFLRLDPEERRRLIAQRVE